MATSTMPKPLNAEVDVLNSNSLTVVEVVPNTTNVTINKGGYITIGKMCITCIKFTPKKQLAASSEICSNMPGTSINPYLRIANGYNSTTSGCRIGGGRLYTNAELATGDSYMINGSFLVI